MKNAYEIRGDVTAIFVNRKNKTYETLIETADLPLVQLFPNTWWMNFYGYIWGTYLGKKYGLHRLIMDAPKELHVDHADGNPRNNCRWNLRLATPGENMQNRHKARKDSLTGKRGVTWDEGHKKWRAYYMLNRKKVYLGLYDTAEEAEIIAKAARAEAMPYSQEAFGVGMDGITDEIVEAIKERAANRPRPSKTGVTGIAWVESRKRWVANLYIADTHFFLGYFESKERAIQFQKSVREKLLCTPQEEWDAVVKKLRGENFKTGKSGIRGVKWDKASNKWAVEAYVAPLKKKVFLGLFTDIKEAEKVSMDARKKLKERSGILNLGKRGTINIAELYD